MRNPKYKSIKEHNKGKTVGNREANFLKMNKGIKGRRKGKGRGVKQPK